MVAKYKVVGGGPLMQAFQPRHVFTVMSHELCGVNGGQCHRVVAT